MDFKLLQTEWVFTTTNNFWIDDMVNEVRDINSHMSLEI
jgi:hypothetical protein